MNRKILCLLILFCFSLCNFAYSKNDEPIMSTQGIEIDENIEKSKVPEDIKNEQKNRKNSSKIYLKQKKKIEKQEYKKRLKQKELEYIKKRLDHKKFKLDSLTPNQEKGEKE